jgi:hypothetical protein
MCYIDLLTDILFCNSRFRTFKTGKSLEATFTSLPKVARLAIGADELLEMNHTNADLRYFGGFEEFIVLPSGHMPHKPVVFKDMCQQTWDSTIRRPFVGPSFSSMQRSVVFCDIWKT